MFYPFHRQCEKPEKKGKADIVPTPYFLSAFFGELGGTQNYQMRTFRLIGMALLALCVNFASCSSDDDEIIKNEEGIVTNQKKLVQMDDDDLTYDAKGRLISIGDWWDYTWAEGVIVCNDDVLTIENNLLRSVEDEDYIITFTYDSKNHLIKRSYKHKKDGYTSDDVYIWEDDKIIKIIDGYDFTEYIYSGKTCKRMMFYPIYTEVDTPWTYLIAAHPELLGTPCLQLPDSEIDHRSDNNTEYTTNDSYGLDEDGYVVSTIKRSESGYTETFTFKWE